MIRLLSLLVIFSMFISCSPDVIKKKDIIEDDNFRDLLIDLHKAEGVITIAKLSIKQNKNDTISPYNFVLKKHNVSRLEFEKTIKYYANHTEEYKLFYDSITSYFDKKKNELELEIKSSFKNVDIKKKAVEKSLKMKEQI